MRKREIAQSLYSHPSHRLFDPPLLTRGLLLCFDIEHKSVIVCFLPFGLVLYFDLFYLDA